MMDETQNILYDILPDEYNYKVTSFRRENENGGFSAELRLAICDKINALEWFNLFQKKSLTTFCVDSTYPENTDRIIFKKRYRCQHNTRPTSHKVKTPNEKHTGCTASVMITIKNKDMKRSSDLLLKELPCCILLKHTHNHTINTADARRHRKPTDELESIFRNVYMKGHSPSSALEIHKIELQEKHGNDYNIIVADGSECPGIQWCYQLYYSLFKKEYGEPTGEEMVLSLHNFINEYNESCGDKCAALKFEDGEITVAICTPLMKRVHTHLRSSGEIVFIDSSGNMDRHNSRIFLLMCASVAGSLPLGIVITYSESTQSIFKGLILLKTLLPTSSFFGKAEPAVIITDDSQAERNSLKAAFQSSVLLLCIFHILQAFLRFVQNSDNRIHKDDKSFICRYFQRLVHCTDDTEFEEMYQMMIKDETISKYQNLVKYLMNLKIRSAEWALCFRRNLLTRGNNTNNYVEASFRILKDKILNRTKAFSVVQLFDFLTRKYDNYYKRKLCDIVNNRYEGYTKSKYYVKNAKLKDLVCERLSEDLFKVKSGEQEYLVDHKIEICTCPKGCQGAPCKHQCAVVKTYKLSSQNFLPKVDSTMKETLHIIMTGEANKIVGWYNTLQNNTVSNDIPVITATTSTSEENEIANIPQDHEDEGNISRLISDVQNFCKEVTGKIEKNPEVFYYAVNKFIKNFKSMKTESSLVSALHTFGPYSGAAVPIHRNLQGGKTIGIQTTSLMRRAGAVGGRHALQSGRPVKNINDHSYRKEKRMNDFDLPQRKKGKNPHSINFNIDRPN